jgi:hypothetical protein
VQNGCRPVPTCIRFGHQRRQNPVVYIWDCHNPSPPLHSEKIPLKGTVRRGAVAVATMDCGSPICRLRDSVASGDHTCSMLAQVGVHFAHICIHDFLSLPAAISIQHGPSRQKCVTHKILKLFKNFQIISIHAYNFNFNGRY